MTPETPAKVTATTLPDELLDRIFNRSTHCIVTDGEGKVHSAIKVKRSDLDALLQSFNAERLRAEAAEAENVRLKARVESAEFWHGVYPDGWNVKRIADEMHDYNMVLDGLGALYMHVTGGMVSKENTDKSVVMQLHDECVTKLTEEAVKDETEDLQKELTAAEARAEALAKDVARLETQVEDSKRARINQTLQYAKSMAAEHERFIQTLDAFRASEECAGAMAVDAKRYRWLRADIDGREDHASELVKQHCTKNLDTAIDTAIEQGAQHG